MSNDDLDHIPSIVPTRDGVSSGKPPKGRPARGGTSRSPGSGGAAPGGGTGPIARLLITVSFVVAVVACAWAWQLQQQLEETAAVGRVYAERIGNLEARLSDTDQGMSQNATVQAAKIREMDKEIRKLWDNVWKKSKERFAKLERDSASHGKKLAATETALVASAAKINSASKDVARLKSVAGDLERLMASAKSNQAEVERVADTLNRINLDLSKLNKRVQGNEEWISSINAFRKQVNANLSELQGTVRSLQASP